MGFSPSYHSLAFSFSTSVCLHPHGSLKEIGDSAKEALDSPFHVEGQEGQRMADELIPGQIYSTVKPNIMRIGERESVTSFVFH